MWKLCSFLWNDHQKLISKVAGKLTSLLPLQESRSFFYTNLHGTNCFRSYWTDPKPKHSFLLSIEVSYHDAVTVQFDPNQLQLTCTATLSLTQHNLAATQSYCNSITLQLNHTATQSHCNSITLQLNHTATQSHCNSITLQLNDTATQSHCNSITLQLNHTATQSHCNSIILQLNHTATQSHCNSITLQLNHTATQSHCYFFSLLLFSLQFNLKH